ncbi:MAG: O-antigen ligase family protein [Anaerolineae bacterium]|nr:O-antigen ligase family protein [Anaerolineae bacterium]
MPRWRIWLAGHIGRVQLAWIAACLPALIFADQVSPLVQLASLLGLALMPALGWLCGRRPVSRTPLDLSIAVMLLLLPFNLWLSTNRLLTLPQVYKVIAGIALFYGIVGLLQETGWFQLSAWGIGILGLALVPIVLLGTDWGSAKFSWMPWKPIDLFPHLFRPFWKAEGYAGFNSNMAGGTLAMLAPLPLAYMLISRKSWIRLLAALDAVLIILALLLTQSRGAILSLAIAMMTMLATRNWRWLFLLTVIAAGSVFALQQADLPPNVAQIEAGSDVTSALSSLAGRLELWARAFYILQDFPLTGIGMGLVVDVLPQMYPTFLISPTIRIEHLHNLFLNTGAELGFPGLISLSAVLIGLFALSWRAIAMSKDSSLAPLALSNLGIIVVICTHGLSDAITFYTRAHVIAWALLGVVAGVGVYGVPFTTEAKDKG